MSDGRKVLIIKAKGGLGNRILSAITGLVYADLSGREAIIDWRDGTYAADGENAYPLLFDTPLTKDPADYDGAEAVTPTVWKGNLHRDPAPMISEYDPTKHSSPTIYRKYCVDLRQLDHSEDVAVFWCYLPKMPRLGRHLRSHPRFAGKTADDIFADYLARYFVPNARVRDEVEALVSKMSGQITGVHIRYTDLKVPLDRILETARDRQKTNPDGSLFLATDNAGVQDKFVSEFSNVHVAPKYLADDGARLHDANASYDKQFEAENAMIDMWTLGRANHLIYSRSSTFSITSALLGAMTPDQQTDVDARNPKIVLKRWVQERI